jgi:predicted GTPase
MNLQQIEALYRMGMLTPQQYHLMVQEVQRSSPMPHWKMEWHYQQPKCKEFTGKPTKVLHIKLSP